jgi:hypothetical protein
MLFGANSGARKMRHRHSFLASNGHDRLPCLVIELNALSDH